MAMKPFDIQEATLKMGGVALQAGNTGVVIPGVTQATSYLVEEVEDSGDQEITFETAPVVIDQIIFNDLVDSGSTAMRAEYAAELDDNGYIDEIEVIAEGTYSVNDYYIMMGANPLYAYTGVAVDPFGLFVQGDWTSIPFEPKMRAGEVESVGGGGSISITEEQYDDYTVYYNPESESFTYAATTGGGNANTGSIAFDGDYMTGTDGVVRMQVQNTQQTAYYSFTPGGDYSTAVWDGTNITFNDPTQAIYDAIWALTDVSNTQVQVGGNWFTVTSSGSSTPGMPQAPTLFVNEAAVDGPLSIDVVDITINQSNESYVEIDGSDFRVDVQDDIRMYANDAFRLINRSVDSSIEIQTNDGNNIWDFRADGVLTLPYNGDIVDNNNNSVLNGKILSTVAQTGSGAPATGEVATITLSPTNNTNFIPGTYPGIFLALGAGFSFTLVVAANGDLSATIISSNGGFTVGDSGALNGVAIAGGTTSVDDITISVASLTNIAYPTVLDLTKQVQKLADGWYTLQDGVEGQIMHLAASSSLTDANSVRVVVANARIGTNVGTDYWLYPFDTYNGGVHGFSTVIFVDGAWQANGGQWD